MTTSPLFHPKLYPDLRTDIELKAYDSWPKARHRFDEPSVNAVEAAIASERPLLIRGEPGIGKSQLARAAAQVLKVPFLSFVVDERTERDDLFCTFDAVARLAQAQVSALESREPPAESGKSRKDADPPSDWRSKLAEENFLAPGVMWWAYNGTMAAGQADRFTRACRECPQPELVPWKLDAKAPCGPVVLIDEIDKADPAIPNGLLECLGNRGFSIPRLGQRIRLADGAPPPLVILTTNEDRELPPAFLRRCLVLQMPFPEKQEAAMSFLLEKRARVYWEPADVSDTVCKLVAEELWKARQTAEREGQPLPGAAEYLDLLRILVRLHSGKEDEQKTALGKIQEFALKKHRDATR